MYPINKFLIHFLFKSYRSKKNGIITKNTVILVPGDLCFFFQFQLHLVSLHFNLKALYSSTFQPPVWELELVHKYKGPNHCSTTGLLFGGAILSGAKVLLLTLCSVITLGSVRAPYAIWGLNHNWPHELATFTPVLSVQSSRAHQEIMVSNSTLAILSFQLSNG